MNQREAKRWVCRHAAMVLENALSANIHGSLIWPNGDEDADGPNEDRTLAAWRDLIAELDRRGAQ
jgi:hypothetical protein